MTESDAVPHAIVGRQGHGALERASNERRRLSITDAETTARFEALAREVGPVAYGIAVAMLGNRASAEDALQDAYLQAFRGLPSFRGDASLRTWFLKIVVNCCKRHRVTWRRWTKVSKELDQTGGEEVTWEQAGDPALRRRLREAVTKLPHRQRAAFVLRYIQNLGIREISEVMECAEGTVKATIHKAVVKLRRELADVT